MMSLHHNKPLLYSLAFSVIALFLLASGVFPPLSASLEIVAFPEEVWRVWLIFHWINPLFTSPSRFLYPSPFISLSLFLSLSSFKGSSCSCCSVTCCVLQLATEFCPSSLEQQNLENLARYYLHVYCTIVVVYSSLCSVHNQQHILWSKWSVKMLCSCYEKSNASLAQLQFIYTV